MRKLFLLLALLAPLPAGAEVPADLLAENEAARPALVRVETLEAVWVMTECGSFPFLEASTRTRSGEALRFRVLDPAWQFGSDAGPAPLPGRSYFVWLRPTEEEDETALYAPTVLPVLEGASVSWKGQRVEVPELEAALARGELVPLEAIRDPVVRLDVAQGRLERKELRPPLSALGSFLRNPDSFAAPEPPAPEDLAVALARGPGRIRRSEYGLWLQALLLVEGAARLPETSPSARETLRSLLNLPDFQRRLGVALILARLGEPDGRAVLEEAIGADDFSMESERGTSVSFPGRFFAERSRVAAAHALAGSGDLRGLASADPEIRLAAGWGAGRAHRQRVEEALEGLRASTAEEVRKLREKGELTAPRGRGDHQERYPREWTAVRGILARLGDDTALLELIAAALEQERTWPAGDDVTTGVRMQVQVWTPNTRQWPSLVSAVLAAEPDRPALLQRLERLTGGPELAALLTPREGAPAPEVSLADQIRERVKSPDPSRRAEGWAAAGRHRIPDLFEATVATALSRSGEERQAALFGLALYGRPVPADALSQLLGSDEAQVRLAAFEIATARPEGLAPARLVEAARELAGSLADEDDRRNLVQWLTRVARREPDPAFLEAMRHPEARVQAIFVAAAARAGNPALRGALALAAEDRDVRAAAVKGLKMLDEQWPEGTSD